MHIISLGLLAGAGRGRLHARDGRGPSGPEARKPVVPLCRRGLQNHDQRFRTLQNGRFGHHGDGLRDSRYNLSSEGFL